ncbi:MAG: 4Fe-4S dicluster domain-containing protein, partial [Oscillospiraceae bacterium]
IAIPGMADIKEAMDNIDGAKKTEFTEKDLADIAVIREKLSGDFCRRCGYCAPCTVGIDIPGVFVLQGYLENYDLEGWARTRYASQAAKASDCIGCGKCEERCPYDLPIRQKLSKIKELFE